jgi:hypothetical protein
MNTDKNYPSWLMKSDDKDDPGLHGLCCKLGLDPGQSVLSVVTFDGLEDR